MLLFDINVILQVLTCLKLYKVKHYISLAILNIIPYKGCDKTSNEL